LTEVHRQALLQRIRSVLAEGRILVVLGWRDSNHDHHTRQLSKEGRVMFYDQAPSTLGSNVGLVISSKFVGHADFERVKVCRRTHPVVLSNGEIKRLLRACDDLLRTPMIASPVVVKTVVLSGVVKAPTLVAPVVHTVEKPLESLTALLNQGPKEAIVEAQQPMVEFARLFKIEAGKSGDGLVGKNVVGEIRRASGLKDANTVLVKNGWIEGVVSEGAKKAGKYRATEKLLAYGGGEAPIESTDPLVRARNLVAQKAVVEEQITFKKVELLELEDKQRKIQAAEALLAQLENLMK
jgi:hypothetical protein